MMEMSVLETPQSDYNDQTEARREALLANLDAAAGVGLITVRKTQKMREKKK